MPVEVSDPIEDAARAWAEQAEDAELNPIGDRLEPYPIEERAAAWEAKIRAALPDLATVLGELAVAREALASVSVGCADGRCKHLAKMSHPPRNGLIRDALDAPAGKLAAEVLRAAVEEAGAREALEASGLDLLHPSVKPYSDRVSTATASLRSAVDAFLTAFPKFKETP